MIRYFDTKHAIEVHSRIIKKSGGLKGYKDIGALESVLEHIRNDIYYPDFLSKITNLVFGINKNHTFNDGNKRASIALSSYFLEINEHDYAIQQYTHGMEEVAVWLATSLIEKEQLQEIIKFLLYEDKTFIYAFVKRCRDLRYFVESNLISKDLLKKIIRDLITDGMYSDDVTFELIEILGNESL